ncbi:MAG: peroxiredoxin [Gammaproteobacteria bacterium]|jgi:peroxiredoxin Q/BCP|nr:peroxiredoxin [Gammaproteobacteria bacterium]
MLKPGSVAPEFKLPDEDGNTRTLAEFLKHGPLIVYFYPADFTPGCTKEACSIRDLHDDIIKSGLQIVGISPQSPESHTRFRETHKLPFPLLADEDKQAVKLYDVNGPLGIGVRRATFLIDSKGVIQDAVLADLFIGEHTEFISKAIALNS